MVNTFLNCNYITDFLLSVLQIKCSANKDAGKHTCEECGLSLSNSYSLHRHLKSQHKEYYQRRKEERLRKKEEQAIRKQELENVSNHRSLFPRVVVM